MTSHSQTHTLAHTGRDEGNETPHLEATSVTMGTDPPLSLPVREHVLGGTEQK